MQSYSDKLHFMEKRPLNQSMPLGYLFYGIICNIEERHTLQKDSRNPFKQTIPAIIFILDFVSFENNRPNFPSEIKKKLL